ncbi:hypothetical protein D3C72_1899330 [compost metagenome]
MQGQRVAACAQVELLEALHLRAEGRQVDVHRLAVHDEGVDAQAAVEAREVAAVDADRVVACAAMHHIARADIDEGVVAGAAFEAVGEAELGDDLVVAVGEWRARVDQRLGAVARCSSSFRVLCRRAGSRDGER